MRTFFRRLSHRDEVLRNLDALLILYPRGRQFPRDFPTLKATIRREFEAGTPPVAAALKIAAGVIGSFIGQLDESGRARVLARLVDTGRAGFIEIVRRGVEKRRKSARDPMLFVAELCGGAIYIAGRMAEEGALRWDEYAEFLRRIETALGVDPRDQQPLARAFAP